MNKKIYMIGIFIVIAFIILEIRLFYLMIYKKAYYEEKIVLMSRQIVEGTSAPRGRIYDRNYNLLVDNELTLELVYKKEKGTDDIELASTLSKFIDIEFIPENNNYLKEYYCVRYEDVCNELVTDEEWLKYEKRELTLEALKELKKSRLKDEVLDSLDKEVAYIYHLMNNGYSYSDKVIKSNNLTEEEIARVSENLEDLPGFSIKENWNRVYFYGDTLKSILGSVSTSKEGIPKELSEYYLEMGYSLNDRIGISNLEKEYENLLKGEKSKYILNGSNLTLLEEAKRGQDIVLTIDIKLQQEVDKIIFEEIERAQKEENTDYYNKSFVVITEPNTGEILAISGKSIQEGIKLDVTNDALTSPMMPGSVVKGASLLVGYNTESIKIGEVFYDNCIKLYNTPLKCSHEVLGRINDLDALAYSSNVYQFLTAIRVGGGNYIYNGTIPNLEYAFNTYKTTFKEFGLGVKTEIDLPVESTGYSSIKIENNLLLNYVMGQYETYTPIQLSQYITTIASSGNRLKLHLLKEVRNSSETSDIGGLSYEIKPTILNTVTTKEEYLNRVKEGMHAVMTYGLGKGLMPQDSAGKTGTSESFLDIDNDGVIDVETISSSFVGFMPYENPTMTITVTSPDVSFMTSSSDHMTYVNRRITKRITTLYQTFYN